MGAVQPSVKVSQFKFIKYLVPIKDEQEKIDNLLSEIDKIINKKQEKNAFFSFYQSKYAVKACSKNDYII